MSGAPHEGDDDRSSDTERPPAPLPGAEEQPTIDFVTYVLSLSSACMVQLEEIAGPDGPAGDLEGAANAFVNHRGRCAAR